VRTEHAAYFNALEQHPRLLVGQEVPAIGREGTEILNTSADAKEWQDAVKTLLAQEVRSRASKQMDEQQGFLTTIHSSISLFQDNPDLVPMTKEFDVELAKRFTTLAEPYELRVEGKLQGYSVPVQPLINQLRTQLLAERAAAPTAAAGPAPASTPAAGGPPPAPPATPGKPAGPPQAGIPSKAGNSGEQGEDFSALWGTLGLPNIQI
jgi:hypothetical protein